MVRTQSETDSPNCQIRYLPSMSEPMGSLEKLWHRVVRLRRIFKRGLSFILNWFSRMVHPRNGSSSPTILETAGGLRAGDLVRIRSMEEIRATLDLRDKLYRCGFMEEMWPYCGTTHRVLKRVEKFLDERDYRVKKTKRIVLLEDVMCEGTKDYGRCDRSCYFFWREEWLGKIERDNPNTRTI